MSLPQITASTNIKGIRASIRKKILQSLPDGLLSTPAIVQVFVNEPHIETKYTLTNFPSFFNPKDASACSFRINLHEPNGAVIYSTDVRLQKFETLEFSPIQAFGKIEFDHGMVSARYFPESFFGRKNKNLGRMRSQFFSLFHSPDFSSMALIHPQTAISSPPKIDSSFRSACVFPLKDLNTITIFQINPTHSVFKGTLSLVGLEGTPKFSTTVTIKPFGSHKIIWNPGSSNRDDVVHIVASNLTTANAKPVVFLEFRSGGFSAFHS